MDMSISTGRRVLLVVLAVLAGIGAFVSYAIEGEYGGQTEIDGLAKGYLPDGVVEVREVDWAQGAEASNDYEMRIDASDIAVVALVDGEGTVLFTGTSDEATAWLDTQGPQQFIGTNQQADAYLTDLADSATSYSTTVILAIVAVGLLVLGLIPNRKPSQSHATEPASPTT